MMAEYMIGTTLGNMEYLEDLNTPIPPPRSEFLPYARTVNLGNGGKRGVGFPIAVWNFPFLTLEERDQLKAFCPGASAQVFIRTKINDDSYATFEGQMIWVDAEERWYGEKRNYSITFRNLVEQEVGS